MGDTYALKLNQTNPANCQKHFQLKVVLGEHI